MTYTIHGHIDPKFRAVVDVFAEQLPAAPRMGGAALTVYHRQQKVLDIWAGVANKEGNAWQADSMSISYSTTKGILSTLAHMLVDRGILQYDLPIAHYWPEFAQQGKHSISLRHVLTHEAGLYHIRSMIQDAHEMLDWPHMLEVMAQARPLHAAGARNGYHALTFGWLVGGLIEKATHAPLSETLAQLITQPLKLDGCFIGVPDSELARCTDIIGAARYKPRTNTSKPRTPLPQQLIDKSLRWSGFNPDTTTEALLPRGMNKFYLDEARSLQACIPGANGVFTARSLAKVYAALANDGEIDGVRLLSPARVKEISRVYNRQRGDVFPMPMHWRLGYHRVFTTWPQTPHAFGHFGYGGSGAWADPSRELGVGYIVNTGSGSPFADFRLWRINTAVIKAAG
ncbi:serine hydrolase domain-containing protein [Agitococcus lubricus]|nr:serine hydrolase domain-containing protein [Agitococcus lubricus]